jgi:hypothetical protein
MQKKNKEKGFQQGDTLGNYKLKLCLCLRHMADADHK